jgi:hypothetical protein
MDTKIGQSHLARKELFARGLRDGSLTVEEIEEALPDGSLTATERWVFYYSLRAAQIAVVGREGGQLDQAELDEAHLHAPHFGDSDSAH